MAGAGDRASLRGSRLAGMLRTARGPWPPTRRQGQVEEVDTVTTLGDKSTGDNGETLIQLHAVSALANLSCVLGSEPKLLTEGVLHVAMRMSKSSEHELVETVSTQFSLACSCHQFY